jgi:elongation factor G
MNDNLDRAFYRETIRNSGMGEGKIVRPRASGGEYAHVQVSVRPLNRGQGNVFAWNAGLTIPVKFVPSIVQGVQAALSSGKLSGHELTDIHAVVENGSYHETDSNAVAFREAAETATERAILEAQPVLLEAIVSATVSVPEEFAGVVQQTIASHGQMIELMHVMARNVSTTTSLLGSQISRFIADVLESTQGRARVSVAVRGFEIKAEPPEPPEEWVAIT